MKSSLASAQTALVTGGNRGIGLEVARQLAGQGYEVTITARQRSEGIAAQVQLATYGLKIDVEVVDVSSDTSVADLARRFAGTHKHLDVLINNAGGYFDADQRAATVDLGFAHEVLDTNLFGAWRMTQALLPLLRASAHARIVNVSSQAGSFGAPVSDGFGLAVLGSVAPVYGLSKAALNALTVKLAADLRDDRILVNAACPGFTASSARLAEAGARPVEQGAASIVWAATLPPEGPTGGFFRDGRPLAW